ncbi:MULTISPECIES: hypothetical protein [unclassified Nostoc]|uniref:hypothetical protein n=1 Tax=unclassified Nostoc TaxID=2593658 RepID=UPI001F557143|nr:MULTISPECIES: hypothetical protein [unclassified Nostoc]
MKLKQSKMIPASYKHSGFLFKKQLSFNWARDLPASHATKMASSEGIKKMDIKRSGSQPSAKGPTEYFTGTVRIDPLFEAHESAR